ncbi:MAG: GNAT family N-acetyltransferase [Rhizobium sp.]|nr:GNAT family N-acetyltransferase [Rhizobium sp.]
MDDDKTITIKDGRTVRLVFNDGSITAHDSSGNKIGEIGFNIQEGDAHHGMPDIIDLYDADVNEDYRRQGIAREAVLFAQEMTGIDIITAPHFADTMKNNGNFLTSDGAALIQSLRRDGIVQSHQNDSDD